MLYNVTTMASTWHTIATADTRLLKHQMDIVTRLPKDYVFLNYLRCHDDIGWGLDYEWLKQFGIAEAPHKKYLNDYSAVMWREATQEESSITTIRCCRMRVSAEQPLPCVDLRRQALSRMRRRPNRRSRELRC